jgi:uncharacterized protein (TIGR00730 family)
MVKTVCVFCGSSAGRRGLYSEAAAELGRCLAERGVRIVYGGGNVGLMGVLADAALAAGGRVTGVIPDHLVTRELAHRGVSELRTVCSMHERKALMADLSDAFVALPGGYGTLEEFCEVLTWSQLGLHAKPCALLNVGGYYDGLLHLFDHAVEEGFVRPDMRRLVLVETEPGCLIDRLAAWEGPPAERWLDPGSR